MTWWQAIIISIVEGLTEYLPISSTAHMIFTAEILGITKNEFSKIFEISIQLGAILAVVVSYRKKFFNFKNLKFYGLLAIAVLPALFLGWLFNEKIEHILEKTSVIAMVLIIGGVVLLFIDNFFRQPEIDSEQDVSPKQAFMIGLWQCLAMMPGTSRSAASIIGGMQQGLSRTAAAEFSFFLAVPTMLAASFYSLFIKNWGEASQKGYALILSSPENIVNFIIGNIVAFIVAMLAIKFFIELIKRFGFKIWGWYRIIAGAVLLLYFL